MFAVPHNSHASAETLSGITRSRNVNHQPMLIHRPMVGGWGRFQSAARSTYAPVATRSREAQSRPDAELVASIAAAAARSAAPASFKPRLRAGRPNLDKTPRCNAHRMAIMPAVPQGLVRNRPGRIGMQTNPVGFG